MKKLSLLAIVLIAASALLVGCNQTEEPEGVANSQQAVEPAPGQKTNPNLKTINPGH